MFTIEFYSKCIKHDFYMLKLKLDGFYKPRDKLKLY